MGNTIEGNTQYAATILATKVSSLDNNRSPN